MPPVVRRRFPRRPRKLQRQRVPFGRSRFRRRHLDFGTYGKLSMGDRFGFREQAIGDLYEVGYTDGSFAGDVEEIAT